MKRIAIRAFRTFDLATLMAAASLVPRYQRAEWLKEWRAELWHVRQACGAEAEILWQAEREVADFCFGAFQDAFCLRQNLRQDLRSALPPKQHLSSADRCLLFLASIAMATWCLFLFLPNARIASQPSPYRDPHHLMLITRAGLSGTSHPTIRAEQFRAWRVKKQQLFSDFAFYRPAIKPVALSPQHSIKLSVAQSSRNLFELLGLPVQLLSPDHILNNDLPKLVVTQEVWQRYFGKGRAATAQAIAVGNRMVEIVGVIPSDQWRLPGHIDAWLLEPDLDVANIPAEARGFLIGHLISSPQHKHLADQWDVSVSAGPDDTDYLTCNSLSSQARGTFDIFFFTVILAFLALPATTSLPLGEYAAIHHKLSNARQLRRWVFFATKLVLILPIVYFGSIDLAYLNRSMSPETSDYIQIVASFSICLFALRWTLRDQRSRCPVCLGKLTNPARVGQPSRTFLAWNGTELICVGGHGLLHVPEMPTSWFSTQRWLYLDSSWEVLFSEANMAAPGTS